MRVPASTSSRPRAPNSSGTISNAIIRAWDGSSGSNGGTADTSTNGDTTAFLDKYRYRCDHGQQCQRRPRILGSELITNGDFTTNLSGWTTSGSVAAVGGRANLGLSNLVGPHSISQTIATVAGQTYQLSFDYFDGSSTRNQSLVATVNGISNLLTTQQIVTDIATTVRARVTRSHSSQTQAPRHLHLPIHRTNLVSPMVPRMSTG